MVQEIEFLPSRYRQRRAARRNVARRVGTLAVVAAGIGAASFWQHGQMRQAKQALAKAEAQEAVVKANTLRLEELKWELANAKAAAELCVFLERHWPRTRIFASVAGAAPEGVELTELSISQEAAEPASTSNRSSAARGGAARNTAEEGPAALRDLRRLFGESGRMRTVVRVAGAAGDPAAIHRFVAELSQNPLFQRTELGSLESLEQPERGAVTRFETRIILRDEFGAPTGESPSVQPLQTARSAP
jgi:hypothetical protein